MLVWLFITVLMPQQPTPAMPLSRPTPAATPLNTAHSHLPPSATLQPIVAAHYTYSVLGPPTISRATFCYVLRVYHSPALPACTTMYIQSMLAGVDPIMVLAWLKGESEFFTDGGSSLRNHNVGNLRCGSRYCHYKTFADGNWAFLMLMRRYSLVWHRPTIAAIMPIYAPDSNIAARIKEAETLVDRWRAR